VTNTEYAIFVVNDMARRLEKFRDEAKPEDLERIREAAERLRRLGVVGGAEAPGRDG
jgi:hypothetical protein